MASGAMTRIVQRIRRAVADGGESRETDADLLTRFLAHKDSQALAVLIRRYAAMVWSVCLRTVGHRQDAEDAFQATFVVLLRKANTIHPPGMVGNWLYGVARQTAMKARAMAMKRHAREQSTALLPEFPGQANGDHPLLPYVDEELSRLPDRYRAVVVLCDLQGQTRTEAARELGCAEGTVASRLARARQMLARRLGRHGLPLSATALGALLANSIAKAAPATVVAAAVQSASALSAAQSTLATGLSQQVLTLAEGMVKTMLLRRLKLWGVTVVAAVLACIAVAGAVTLLAEEADTTAQKQPLVAHAAAAGQPKKSAKAEDDLAKFQGTWQVVSFHINGEQADIGIKSLRLTFKNKAASSRFEKKDGTTGEEKMTFDIDATKSPKEITISDERIVLRGIYRFDKDKLILCYFSKPNNKRPTSFSFKDAAVDDLPLVTQVLEREPADQKPMPEKSGQANAKREGVIEGTLVDDRTNKPIANAVVACSPVINEKGGGVSATTDASGKYRLEGLSPGIYHVWLKRIDADSRATALADDGLEVLPGKIVTSRLRLLVGRKVSGKVLDQKGTPVKGKSVGCYSPARPTSGATVHSTTTNVDGSFEFHLPPGRAWFYVMHDGLGGDALTDSKCLTIPQAGDVSPFTLVLRPFESRFGAADWLEKTTPGTQIVRQNAGPAVSGVVLDAAGRPVPDARVFRTDGRSAVTDGQGRFSLAAQTGEQFIMNAFAPGFRVWHGTPTSGDVLHIVLEKK